MAEFRQTVMETVRETEESLALPMVQERTPIASVVRDTLIRQLWLADRVAALIRDGGDYAAEREELQVVGRQAASGLSILRNTIHHR